MKSLESLESLQTITQSFDFTRCLLDWFEQHGRYDLPWQHDPTPYRVWVSEIMLQQTQANTVIPYFIRFMKRFPDVGSLAAADLDEVLHYWAGLGYYARGRNLHRAAKIIAQEYDGRFPTDLDTLLSLPGIGRSTAGAILALACNQRHPILDGNVKRVLTRFHAVRGWTGETKVEQHLWTLAERYTPHKNVAQYTQAIMDLGAMICTRRNPRCDECPVSLECAARKQASQHNFPSPKPRKTLPVRTTVFAILENEQGAILLEQRAPSGVWGGLWGFPECTPQDDIRIWINNRLGFSVDAIQYKSLIRHTFSHFHLDIIPVHVCVNSTRNIVHDSNRYCWYIPGENQLLGMAAPVKKLLKEITCLSAETLYG